MAEVEGLGDRKEESRGDIYEEREGNRIKRGRGWSAEIWARTERYNHSDK
jgi:hypothetical protein